MQNRCLRGVRCIRLGVPPEIHSQEPNCPVNPPIDENRCLLALVLVCSIGLPSFAWATQPAHVEFFENRIRPVLIEHCYECHSDQTDDVGGSLWLDSAQGMSDGGDSGPAIAPGNIDGSLLISAIRYESSEMPPSGKLPNQVIEDFERWIRDGAVDPRGANTPKSKRVTGIDLEAGRRFWAFQPVRSNVGIQRRSHGASSRRSGSWIDGYLDEELDEHEIVSNPLASPDTRLRRLCFDLTGLPPTSEIRNRWKSDPSQINWSKMVDELLASKEFAEHWARHAMDVARYADSNGSDFNATFHDAWRYRDYLVRHISQDTPMDQMIRHQIAGDLMPFDSSSQRHDQLIATTFLMLGTKMLSERNKAKLTMDVVDEQIDTVGRAFMGMTLGCARCHDHKFDPIPTEDYYALAGIFRSTQSLKGESQQFVSTWKPTPLPASPELQRLNDEYRTQLSELSSQVKSTEKRLKAVMTQKPRLKGTVIDDEQAIRTGKWTESTYMPGYVGRGYSHDDNRNKGELSIRFSATLPEAASASVLSRWQLRLWYSPGTTRADKIPVRIQVGEKVTEKFISQRNNGRTVTFLVLGEIEAKPGTKVEVEISNRDTSGYVIADALQIIDLNEAADASDSSDADSTKQGEQHQVEVKAIEQELARLKAAVSDLKENAPPALPQAMAVRDVTTDQIADCQLHIRGEVNNLGESVPRGFLQVCGTGDARIRPDSTERIEMSGRLGLANWLTDPDHPLTARVAANRIWMRLMGEGIVRTVDNFGSRGERPSHPELLDALAIELVRRGWSRKHLIRQIVLTDAYQRSSESNDESESLDPENRLWWRAHRKRLPAESIRDAMLVVSGKLDRTGRFDTMAGYGTLVSANNGNSKATHKVSISDAKRTLYLPVIRSEIPPLLATLDAADPDLLVGKRPTTNVPAQALALIGSDVVRDWAGQTAQRLVESIDGPDERIDWVYQAVLQRSPVQSDRELVRAWLSSERAQALKNDQQRWHEWIAAMFAGTEFRILE